MIVYEKPYHLLPFNYLMTLHWEAQAAIQTLHIVTVTL